MRWIVVRLLLAMALLVPSALLSAPVASAQAADTEAECGDTAVEVAGEGDYANLKIKVSRTTNLINEAVRVCWTGGVPSAPQFGPPRTDFLQIMQCWGDGPDGPDRTQCQFGKSSATSTPGPFLRRFEGATDPAEVAAPVLDATGAATANFIPFWPAGAAAPAFPTVNPDISYFDSQSTNEVPYAATRADGSGEVSFEMQTRVQASGLGCGTPVEVAGVVTGRSCWLVVVPRGKNEVDGTPRTPLYPYFDSSPLSQTNWNNRIVVPLSFLPQGRACPIGAAEQRVTGNEIVVDAVSQWQPALCANGGSLFSFTQLNDDLVRSQLVESVQPGLTISSNPVPPDQVPVRRPIVYAPVALSGLVVAFRIVRNPDGLEPDDPRLVELGAGKPFTEMNLTPRLMAKLLTQSYRGAVFNPLPPGVSSVPATNAWGLTNDKEFLAINPDYDGRLRVNLHVDALVQSGTSDLIGLLWDWVLSDADARAFVDGVKDPYGMVVNEANKGRRAPLFTYPRNDQSCLITRGVQATITKNLVDTSFCTIDAHPYTGDMHESARAASRGDTLARDPNSITFQPDDAYTYGRLSRLEGNAQALIAVVDAATAERYGLATAKLRNAAGQFVAPDAAGLGAGLAAMKPSGVEGVLRSDPAATDPAAYPLTSLNYASTSPPALTVQEGKDYAAFLRYAVGPGQESGTLPGQLPPGYAPLSPELRTQTLAAATRIESEAGLIDDDQTPTPTPAVPPGSTTTGNGLASTAGTGNGQVPARSTTVGPTPAPRPATPLPLGPTAPSAPSALQPTAGISDAPVDTPAQTAAALRRTPALPAGAVGAVLVAVLVLGGLSAVLAPVMHLLGTPQSTVKGGDAADRTTPRRTVSWHMARPALSARRR